MAQHGLGLVDMDISPPAAGGSGSGGVGAVGRSHVIPGPLPLLELPPGLLTNYIVPRLQPHQQAALSLTCKQLRRIVHESVRTVTLAGGRCCPAVRQALHRIFPGVQSITLAPSNLHEAMNVIPSLLMTMGQELLCVSRVVLHDKLPDEPSERHKCSSCNAWRNTYDLAAILFTIHGCLSRTLREFDFTTHYISNAECMAVGHMTGLTSLRCSSPHGFSAGGLAALSRLTGLRRLEITDAPRSWTEGDVEAVAGMVHLTRLAFGGSAAMLRPLLRGIAAAHGLVEGAVAAPVAALVPAVAVDESGGAESAAAGSGKYRSSLQLMELDIAFDWMQTTNADLLPVIACLSSLTSLTIAWPGQSAHHSSIVRRCPLRSCRALSALGALPNLRELSAAWPVDREVFAALAQITALTAITLGTLPLLPPTVPGAPPPAPQPAPTSRMPHIKSLTVAASRWGAVGHAWAELSHERQRLTGLDGGHTAAWVDALVALPGIERLVLDTEAVRADTLCLLPAMAPHLTELRLPMRLCPGVGPSAVRTLGQLTALRRLRVGWKSSSDEGPPQQAVMPLAPPLGEGVAVPLTLKGVFCTPPPTNATAADAGKKRRRASTAAMTSTSVTTTGAPRLSLVAASHKVPGTGESPEVALHRMTLRHHRVTPASVVLRAEAAAFNAATSPPLADAPPTRRADQGMPFPAAVATAAAAGMSGSVTNNAVVLQGGAPKPRRAALFPALRSLEVCGPAHYDQIASLCTLPRHVTELVVSDNPSWSTGLPQTALLLAARAPGLRRLCVWRCRGVDGRALEGGLLRYAAHRVPFAAPGPSNNLLMAAEQNNHPRGAASLLAGAVGSVDASGCLSLDVDLDFEPCPSPPLTIETPRGFPLAAAGPAAPPGAAGGLAMLPAGLPWFLDGPGGAGHHDDDDDAPIGGLGGWMFAAPGQPPAPPPGAAAAWGALAAALPGGAAGAGMPGDAGGGAGGAGAVAQAQAQALAAHAHLEAQLDELQEQLGLALFMPPGLAAVAPPGGHAAMPAPGAAPAPFFYGAAGEGGPAIDAVLPAVPGGVMDVELQWIEDDEDDDEEEGWEEVPT